MNEKIKTEFYFFSLTCYVVFSIYYVQTAFGTEPVCEAKGSSHCYYVNNSSSGDCSFNNPCSIENAISKIGAGDYMYILDGVYSKYYQYQSDYGYYGPKTIINLGAYFKLQSPPTSEKPVVIKAYPGHHPIINGNCKTWPDCITWPGCIVVDEKNNIIIDGLRVRNCGGAGIRIGYNHRESHRTTDITVKNSNFSDIYGNDNLGGVFIHSANTVLIENNIFHDNHYKKNENQQKGSGVMIFQGIDITIKNNEFYNLKQGMYYKHGEAIKGAGGYTKITNNDFFDINDACIGSNQNRTKISNNLLNGCSIFLYNDDGTKADFMFDTEIKYNTMINSKIAFPRQWGRYGKFSGPINTTVINNIFYNSDYRIWTYGTDDKFNEGIKLTSYNNCFYNSSGSQEIGYFANNNPQHGGENTGDTYYITQTEPPSRLLWQSLGYGLNSIEANPLFVDILTNNFKLQTNSPCLGKGADVNEIGVMSTHKPHKPIGFRIRRK